MKMNEIRHFSGKPSIITLDNDIFEAKCINCKNKKCLKYVYNEITNNQVKIPTSIDSYVCPVGAISEKNGKVIIDNDKCIKCGLCAARCLTGAIYFNGDKFVISGYKNDIENKYVSLIHVGQIIQENDTIINDIYNRLIQSNVNPNILSRNLLNQCGIQTILSRTGDVNLRMDGIIINNNRIGVCEIEFNNDVLSCPRCILDDIAVLCSRYDYDLEEILALVISLYLPNNRTDYWRVIKDIKNILDIEIQTLSIGFLLITMWNFKKVNLISNQFYKDCDNNSLRENMEVVLNRKVNVIDDNNGILDSLK